jgi:hypothetical protein
MVNLTIKKYKEEAKDLQYQKDFKEGKVGEIASAVSPGFHQRQSS